MIATPATDTNPPVLKSAAWVALAGLFILFIGSILFYKERLFADTSYIAFNIINYRTLSIQNQRYGSFITQLVPYCCQKLGLPLRAILVTYAVSFNLFFLVVGTVLVRVLRQYRLAILMSLYYFLIVSDSYYLANDELHQGVAWMFLMYGTLIHLGNRKASKAVLLPPFILLALLTIFSHFIIIIPVVFIWVYLVLEKRSWPFSKRDTILLSSIMALVMVVKFAVSATSQRYEQEHLHNITHLSLADIIHSFDTPVIRMFCYRSIINYWSAVILLCISVAVLIKNKDKALALWSVLSFAGYCIIMGVSFRDQDANVLLFHIETEWQSIGIIMATPFVCAVLPRLRMNVAAGAIAAILLVRMVYIGASAPAFIWRVHFHEQVLKQMEQKNITKLALFYDKAIGDKYMIDWATPYESLFASALNNNGPHRTFLFVHKDDVRTQEALKECKGFYAGNCIGPGSIDPEYFRPDTTQPYQIMSYEGVMAPN